MLFNQKMQSLSILAFFGCIAFTVATEKETACCKEVSSRKLTMPISGFKLQQPRPPCVKAVIFYTSKGAICSHWKESWVKEKVTELRQLQAINKSLKINTTTVTANTTYSLNNTTDY